MPPKEPWWPTTYFNGVPELPHEAALRRNKVPQIECDVSEDSLGRVDSMLEGSNTGLARTQSFGHYAQPLSINDLDSCMALEKAAYISGEPCSREKLAYRLTNCSAYCLGMFVSATRMTSPTWEAARSPDSTAPKRKSVLIGHIIATKTDKDILDADDLEIPDSAEQNQKVRGHKESGTTIAILSIAMLPQYQNLGIARLLLKEYVDRHHGAGTNTKITVLANFDCEQLLENTELTLRDDISNTKWTAKFKAIGETTIDDQDFTAMLLDFKKPAAGVQPDVEGTPSPKE